MSGQRRTVSALLIFRSDACLCKNQPSGGWIELICGSMFSGKTEELLRRVRRAEIARQPHPALQAADRHPLRRRARGPP